MSVSFSLQASPTFPEGATVGAYPKWSFPGNPSSVAPGVAPLVSAVVQADGRATFVGLEYDTTYYAGALVGDAWRFVGFRTVGDPSYGAVELVGGVADGESPEWDAASSEWVPVAKADRSETDSPSAVLRTATPFVTGRLRLRDNLSVADFGSLELGADHDTVFQEAIGYAEDNEKRRLWVPEGNFELSGVTLTTTSLIGAHPSRPIAGIFDMATALGSRLNHKLGATDPLITLAGDVSSLGWDGVQNLSLVGRQIQNVTAPKRPIVSSADRRHFVVSVAHLPDQPTDYLSFPYYGVCLFMDADGHSLGTGIVQSVDTGTGEVTLVSGTDNYTGKTGSGNLLTSTEQVAFAPKGSWTGDGVSVTDYSDSAMLSPPGLHIHGRTKMLRNLFIKDFWCGIVSTSTVTNFDSIWTNGCGMAGWAARIIGSGADVSGTKLYIQGNVQEDVDEPARTVSKIDTYGHMSLCGLWGVPSYSGIAELTTNNCYHGVVDCGGGLNTHIDYCLLDIPFKEPWMTFAGAWNGGDGDPTISFGQLTCRANRTAYTKPAVLTCPSGALAAIGVKGTNHRKLKIGSLAAIRDLGGDPANDFAYVTNIAVDATNGVHDIFIDHISSVGGVSNGLSWTGVKPFKSSAPFGAVNHFDPAQVLARRVLIGANNDVLFGTSDDHDKKGTLGIPNYDSETAPVAIVTAYANATINTVYVGGGDTTAEAAQIVELHTGAAKGDTGTGRLRVRASGQVSMRSGDTGAVSADVSAVLDLQGTDAGFLPPRVTTAQRNAISAPATGLVVFNTDTERSEVYQGSAWVPFSYDPAQAQNGMWCCPNSSFTISTTVAAASTARFARFIPRRKLTVVKIGFVTTIAATNNDAVDVGLYAADGTKLVSSGATTGKANATAGAQKIDVASTVLHPGVVYYAALAYGTVGGTAATLQTLSAGAAGTPQMFGATAGLLDSGVLAGATVPSPLTFASPSSTAFNLAVLES